MTIIIIIIIIIIIVLTITITIIIIIIIIIIIKIIISIVSITKFSFVLGSPRPYLPRNRRAITWVSNYRCPISNSSNRTPVIGYPRDFHVNYARFNGFLSNLLYSFPKP